MWLRDTDAIDRNPLRIRAAACARCGRSRMDAAANHNRRVPRLVEIRMSLVLRSIQTSGAVRVHPRKEVDS
jgi:hypothetical protein